MTRISAVPSGDKNPAFGRTQYRLGAVVFILNATAESFKFFNAIDDVETLNKVIMKYQRHYVNSVRASKVVA